jgi:KaiC/GvpD/RAD55 family RecA-like ATPase
VGEKTARARPSEGRVSLGVPELDVMLDGGLVAHRPYLVVGASGTGKTTLALQFLCEGIRRGERGLYVTVENPPNEIRINHRALGPELDQVEVFDAIPDVMRYEKAPFKDISSVRGIVPFSKVDLVIRQSPDFSSVEVTVAALEQMLRSEVQKRKYTRLVIDSLTALQYFCMKGLDLVSTAQTFLRFLSDLGVTTLLTVEAPLEEIETPERTLARGEIRLFRWELDGSTVRAIGVEKFRGSSHDVRLHPYRLGPKGVAVNLEQTISRDSRRIVEPALQLLAPALAPRPEPPAIVVSEAVRDLLTLGADVTPVREEVEATLADLSGRSTEKTEGHLARLASLVIALAQPKIEPPARPGELTEPQAAALQRAVERADRARTGVPPSRPPPSDLLRSDLENVLSLLTPRPAPFPPPVPRGATALPPPVPPAEESRPPQPSTASRSPNAGMVGLERWGGPEGAAPSAPAVPADRSGGGPAPSDRSPPSGDRSTIPAPPPLPAAAPVPPPPASKAEPTPRPSAPATPPSPASVPVPPAPSRTAPQLPSAPAPRPPAPAEGSAPVVPPLPTPSSPPGPSGPAAQPPAAAPAPPTRRRRRSAAKSATAPEGPPAEGALAVEKPKRRGVRRRKAPPVVGAVEETVPAGVYGKDEPTDRPPPAEGT